MPGCHHVLAAAATRTFTKLHLGEGAQAVVLACETPHR
jgi:hypothetical protein